jgi:hypothetical protein
VRTQQCGAARLTARQWCLAATMKVRDKQARPPASSGPRSPSPNRARGSEPKKESQLAWRVLQVLCLRMGKGELTVRTTPRSEAEIKAASPRKVIKPGLHPARITEASERPDKNGDDMIELVVDVGGRLLKDWLSDKWAAGKLRSCCDAVGAFAAYEAGEISPEDLIGDVQVKIIVEKRRGFPDQNRIEDYRAAAASSVVRLRSAE